jgi:hypothetical protein
VKRLYHYTSIERWRLIEAAGYLRRTESNLSMTTEHAGPDVVWLTTDPDYVHDHGLSGTYELTPLQLDGFSWLLGHAELDNGLTWCGRWHVDNGLDARCERLAQWAAMQLEMSDDEGQP